MRFANDCKLDFHPRSVVGAGDSALILLANQTCHVEVPSAASACSAFVKTAEGVSGAALDVDGICRVCASTASLPWMTTSISS